MLRRSPCLSLVLILAAAPTAWATAYTGNTTGNWNSATTWSGAGIPGSGDTATINASVVVTIPDGYTATIGLTGQASGSTGLTISSGGSLVLGSGSATTGNGGVLVLQQDLLANCGATGAFTVKSGSVLTFSPSNGQQVTVKSNQGSSTFTLNGSTGGRIAVSTDGAAITTGGGIRGYFYVSGSSPNMIQSAQYVDFTDLADSTTPTTTGMCYSTATAAGQNITISSCTFTRCAGWKFTMSGNTTGSCTITNNRWASSYGSTYDSQVSNLRIIVATSQTGGTRVVTGNVFDLGCDFNAFLNLTIQHNVFCSAGSQTCVQFIGTGNGVKYTSFDSNLVYSATGWSGSTMHNAMADITNCLYNMVGNAGAHYHSSSAFNTQTISGNVYDAGNASNTGSGDVLLATAPNSGATVVTSFFNNVILPTYGTSNQAGTITLANSTLSSGQIVIEHNTIFCGSQHAIQVNEALSCPAGSVASVRANLAWQSSTSPTRGLFFVITGTPNTDICSPATLDYNGLYDLNTAVPWPSSGYTNTGRSCDSNFSSVPNANALLAADPQFVDSTRCMARWWLLTQGGSTTGTLAGDSLAAVAYVATNPTTYIPACRTWILAGYQPKNSALKAASYPGDTSTTDAAGNAWPGGSPGIGAMGYSGSIINNGAAILPAGAFNGPVRRDLRELAGRSDPPLTIRYKRAG